MAKNPALTQFHRDAISTAASTLFVENGIEKTTMEDIAKKAQYSKATLYVYFTSKEDIFHYIVLKGMQLLLADYTQIIQQDENPRDQYFSLCNKLLAFSENYPLHFQGMLETIAVDRKSRESSEILENIYQVGEMLNDSIEALLQRGIQQNVFKSELSCLPTVLVLWAALSGVATLASKKQEYILARTGMTKQQFTNYSFEMMLRTLLKD